eukprot:scaffold58941_cov31-Tisochrysis_lutea.AAC.1
MARGVDEDAVCGARCDRTLPSQHRGSLFARRHSHGSSAPVRRLRVRMACQSRTFDMSLPAGIASERSGPPGRAAVPRWAERPRAEPPTTSRRAPIPRLAFPKEQSNSRVQKYWTRDTSPPAPDAAFGAP